MERYFNILLGIMLVFSLLPAASAELTLDTNCDDGVYYERLHNNSAIVINNSFTCPVGCAFNGFECDLPVEPEVFLPIGIAFSVIAAIFAFLSYKVDEEHWPLQFLFLVSSMAFVVGTAYYVSGFATLTMNSLNQAVIGGYQLGIWTLIIVFMYFLFLFFKALLERMKSDKASGKPFKL